MVLWNRSQIPLVLRNAASWSGVIDGFHRQVEFILMAPEGTAVFRAAISEDTVHWNLVLLEERQDPVI
jgi:hypothetical protein